MLKKSLLTSISLIFLLSSPAGRTQEVDPRELVAIPDESLELMRQDMIGMLSSLNEILKSLAASDFKTAADIAENHMGRSAMGKHRATGKGPGRFMPADMRSIAWGLHDAASEFAEIALKEDRTQIYIALNKVTGHCVACHNAYRTR